MGCDFPGAADHESHADLVKKEWDQSLKARGHVLEQQ